MSAAISVNSTQLWPTLGETFAEFSRERVLTRETVGTDALPRTLDRMNGMERTGAADNNQRLFGGIVAGDSVDWSTAGHFLPRDAFTQTDDLHRGMQVLHMGVGGILNTSV